ncbi:MAG: tyrosine--tRNA ligase [Candidatus Aenigmarchaeota archaeon]|nr:tyrosine--tRNA ligase [Candidatus Aenigmarchaeota archaeon]
MNVDDRFNLIKEVGEEIITEEDLMSLLQDKKNPIAYDGFEPSGKIHIAQGLLRAINVNKMTKSGCKFKMFVADWHGWANNKMGGDLEKIQKVGKYFVEVWRACGMDLDNVEFIWASEILRNDSYWKKVMEMARNSTVQRILRCGQIMGRKEGEVQQASQILYPCMQAADIFELEADICQLGMDQRKVNMLARELGPKLGYWKPVIVSHHMLMGLGEPPTGETDTVEKAIAMKMSKSNPDSAIFMNDTEEDIKRKIKKAYCPEKQLEENPILEYCRYIIFEKFKEFKIERPEKFGGTVEFASYDELSAAFAKGDIHPLDLKNATAFYVNELVKPVRDHFEKDNKAKKMFEEIKQMEVTR